MLKSLRVDLAMIWRRALSTLFMNSALFMVVYASFINVSQSLEKACPKQSTHDVKTL